MSPWFRRMIFILGVYSSAQAVAVEAPKPRLDAPPSPLNEETLPMQEERVVRVRIPLQFQGYEKVIVTDHKGMSRYQYKPLPILKHHLRARLERKNHFYVGGWHIESIPERWDRASKQYAVKLRIYKRYGEGRELEELIGKVEVSGKLEGKDLLYNFKGFATASFKDREGRPVLDLGVGHDFNLAAQLKIKGPTVAVKPSAEAKK